MGVTLCGSKTNSHDSIDLLLNERRTLYEMRKGRTEINGTIIERYGRRKKSNKERDNKDGKLSGKSRQRIE